MSEALKETKVTRRNGKAAVTWAGKSLQHTIESKRPGTEVRESLAKVQRAYEKLTQKHEELTKLIEGDEEFEKEEMWFEECQEMFMRVEVQAKEYIDETETVKNISVSMKDDILNDVVETYPGSASPPQNNSGMLGMQSGGNQSLTLPPITPQIRVALKWRNQRCLNSPETLESMQYLRQTLNTRLNRSTARAVPSPTTPLARWRTDAHTCAPR